MNLKSLNWTYIEIHNGSILYIQFIIILGDWFPTRNIFLSKQAINA